LKEAVKVKKLELSCCCELETEESIEEKEEEAPTNTEEVDSKSVVLEDKLAEYALELVTLDRSAPL
jgi:hypothetical protein